MTKILLLKTMMTGVLLAAMWLSLAVPAEGQSAGNQDAGPMPAPARMPAELPPAPLGAPGSLSGAQWLDEPLLGGGGMSPWDEYMGRVYANSSPVWVSAEYLLWWISGNAVPALVTTSPEGTPVADAGVLGQPGTATLFGGDRVDYEARSGFRTELGVRLGHLSDALADAELEASFFWLGDGQSTGSFFAESAGGPILARPFWNSQLDAPDSQLVAYPGIVLGDIRIQTDSDVISAGLRFRRGWRQRPKARVDWLLGYRYLRHRENLTINERLESMDPMGTVEVGTLLDVYDEFAVWNEFHGLDLGLQWGFKRGCWSAELLTKIAVGSVFRTVEIFGETIVVPPIDAAFRTDGGLLALPSNMGRHRSDEFAILPEIGVKLRRQLTHSFVLTLGYNVTVINHMARTGDQIDTTLNLSQAGDNPLTGDARPAFSLTHSNLWLHGFSVGLQW
jgi:hypothetical protein